MHAKRFHCSVLPELTAHVAMEGALPGLRLTDGMVLLPAYLATVSAPSIGVQADVQQPPNPHSVCSLPSR
jgi:hypothetical protein